MAPPKMPWTNRGPSRPPRINQVEQVGTRIWSLIHEPGNGTRYEIIAADISTPWEDRWLIAVPNFGASLEITEPTSVDPEYVAEKMRIKLFDATAIASGIYKIFN